MMWRAAAGKRFHQNDCSRRPSALQRTNQSRRSEDPRRYCRRPSFARRGRPRDRHRGSLSRFTAGKGVTTSVPCSRCLPMLSLVAATPKVIKVHFGSHDTRPPSEIPCSGRVCPNQRGAPTRLLLWSSMSGHKYRGGQDLHDRFFLTEVGGLMIGAGLSAEGPARDGHLHTS